MDVILPDILFFYFFSSSFLCPRIWLCEFSLNRWIFVQKCDLLLVLLRLLFVFSPFQFTAICTFEECHFIWLDFALYIISNEIFSKFFLYLTQSELTLNVQFAVWVCVLFSSSFVSSLQFHRIFLVSAEALLPSFRSFQRKIFFMFPISCPDSTHTHTIARIASQRLSFICLNKIL